MLYPRCRKPLFAITHAPQPSHTPVTSFSNSKSSCDHWDYRGFPRLLSDRHIQNVYRYEEIAPSNALRSPLPRRVSHWRHSASNALRVPLPKCVSLWRHRSLKCSQMTTARTSIIMKTVLLQMLPDRHCQNMYHYDDIFHPNAIRSPLPKSVASWRHRSVECRQMPEGVGGKPLAHVKTSVESRAGYGLMVVRRVKCHSKEDRVSLDRCSLVVGRKPRSVAVRLSLGRRSEENLSWE